MSDENEYLLPAEDACARPHCGKTAADHELMFHQFLAPHQKVRPEVCVEAHIEHRWPIGKPCTCGEPLFDYEGHEAHLASILAARLAGAGAETTDDEAAWQDFRRDRYIDPAIDTPALGVTFRAGYREAVKAMTTRAKHLADEWESHPDGDIQMFVARLLEGNHE